MPRNRRIWVAGHTGLAGAALVRALRMAGNTDVLTVARRDLDLRDQAATQAWIRHNTPDVIVMAAGTVGGIEANRRQPADFLYDNMMMAANVMQAAATCSTGKLVYLGSSCVYPRDAAQPITPGALMTGPLEPSNEAYAVAKIAAIRLAQSYRIQHGHDFVSVMPCNLYGPGDRFDPVRSHVIPAMMMKFHQACLRRDPVMTLWGSGTPLREFLHADDLARALIRVIDSYSATEPVNIGSGAEISIRDLAVMMADITGYRGDIRFDTTMPDGTPRKVMDSSIMRGMGWEPSVALRDGLAGTYAWYAEQEARCA